MICFYCNFIIHSFSESVSLILMLIPLRNNYFISNLSCFDKMQREKTHSKLTDLRENVIVIKCERPRCEKKMRKKKHA